MAIVKGFPKGKRPVVELTRVQAVVDGHHYIQYPMVEGTGELENGMLVAVDHVKGEVGKAKAITEEVYLHASVEHMYDEFAGRDEFVVKETDDFLPRAYKLLTGDAYETNAVVWDTAEFKDGYIDIRDTARDADVYAYVDVATGYAKLTKQADEGVKTDIRVANVISLPNGERGVKLVVK